MDRYRSTSESERYEYAARDSPGNHHRRHSGCLGAVREHATWDPSRRPPTSPESPAPAAADHRARHRKRQEISSRELPPASWGLAERADRGGAGIVRAMQGVPSARVGRVKALQNNLERLRQIFDCRFLIFDQGSGYGVVCRLPIPFMFHSDSAI